MAAEMKAEITRAAETAHSRYSRMAQAMLEREVRHEMIAKAAYFRAERRGFEPGHDVEDWLAAETEIDTGLTLGLFCE